jgi:hypothetical protein
MTNWHLRGLGTVLIATLVAFVPLTAALAATSTGLDSEDPAPEAESSRISTVTSYPRSAYVWPFATGPSYGGADPTSHDFFIAHSGGFNLQRPLGIPQELRTPFRVDSAGSQMFVVIYHPDLAVYSDIEYVIEATGGKVVDMANGRTLFARLTPGSYQAISTAVGIIAVEPYHAAFKLSPQIGRNPLSDATRALSDVYELKLRLWEEEARPNAVHEIAALGATVIAEYGDTVVVEAHRSLLPAIADLDAVQSVHESLPAYMHAEETTATVQIGNWFVDDDGSAKIPYTNAGIDGSGGGIANPQRMMEIDSGIQLDAGDLSDTRTDPGVAGSGHRKVQVYESVLDFGGQGDLLGCDGQSPFTHGHTVATTALGWGSDVDEVDYNGTGWLAFDLSGNGYELNGVAPGARLVAYDAQITPASGGCDNPLEAPIVPGDLYDGGTTGACPGVNCPGSLGEAYWTHGVRVFNMSWGFSTNDYPPEAADIDLFLFTRKDAMVFVSSGNNGADDQPDGGDGIPDDGTMGSPSTAKSGMAIGASRNANTGPSPEFREDFSGMGPAISTTVNRVAPILMAPGGEPVGGGALGLSSEFSCTSGDINQVGTVDCNWVTFLEGTSFSSPAAAGAALVIRDYFAQGFYPNATQTPSQTHYIGGALVKAILIASANFMTGFDPNLTRRYRFNNEQGYGRIQLDRALPLESWPDSPIGLAVHDPTYGTSDLSLSGSISDATTLSSTTFVVCDDEQNLTVVLSWMDRSNATGAIFNDLDLELVAPSTLVYRGNYFTDDANHNESIDAGEDCGSIGALDPDTGNLEVEGGNPTGQPAEFSLPVCTNTKIQGTSLTLNAFDNANSHEAIFLSPNPNFNFSDPPINENPIFKDGQCITGSDNAGQVCGNHIDCMDSPPVCNAGAGLCLCGGPPGFEDRNEGKYQQPELGEWTIRIRKGATAIPQPQDYAVAIVGGVCLGSTVRLDRGSYTCNQDVEVTVSEVVETDQQTDDPDASDVSDRASIEVLENGVVVDVEDGFTFTEAAAGGKFTSDRVQMTSGTARDPGNGVLDVRPGDQLRAVYLDVDVSIPGPNLDITRSNVASVECRVRVNIGTVLFSLYGQDDNFGIIGGCERNVRNEFFFGFPDRYMDADETIYGDFLFDSAEQNDLDGVTASLRCVDIDDDSPKECLADGSNCDEGSPPPEGCGGPCDPRRENNPECDWMTVLNGTPENPLQLGFLPGGGAVAANFGIQMAGDGPGEPFAKVCDTGHPNAGSECAAQPAGFCGGAQFCNQPSPTIELLLNVAAGNSGKVSSGIVVNRQRLNVDESSVFYSTDFPAGGTEIVEGGPGIASNNDELAFDPIIENGTFQGNDYRFETNVWSPLTAGKDANGGAVSRNQNLLSPWNFDANDGGFSVGLTGDTDEGEAASSNLHNWGEDKNFNGIEDGECFNTTTGLGTGVACYIFGTNTDARCLTNQQCRTREDNAQNGNGFANFEPGHWGTKGGCGWQTRASASCSIDARGCFNNADCLGVCYADGNGIVSTFAACGTGQPPCPSANQCHPSADNKLIPCTNNAQCGNGGPLDVCQIGVVVQNCKQNGGVCTGAATGTGGVWHTGVVGATSAACGGGVGSACANYKAIAGVLGQKEWFELLVTPLVAKLNQEEGDLGPEAKAEITDFMWNAQTNLSDSNAAYTWELDTDTDLIEPLDIFADGTVLNGLGGPYGAIAEGSNPALTRGWPVFATPSDCSDNGAPCESIEDCNFGTCAVGGADCHFNEDCNGGVNGPCNGVPTCDLTVSGLSVNGSSTLIPNNNTFCTAAGVPEDCCTGNNAGTCPAVIGGNGNRTGDMGCFFEGTGKLPVTALDNLSLARPLDDDIDNDGDGLVDEFVTPAGPYRNNDVQQANGPDMRFFTLEDIYLDTGNSFRAAIGFLVTEGTGTNQAMQSYGLAMDDMAIEWREFTLEGDLVDCATSGSCAVLELTSGTVFLGQTAITVTLLESTPPSENDCDNDGIDDGVDDCDSDGTPDLVIVATSAAETAADPLEPYELIYANQTDDPGGNEYRGFLPISVAGDSPGTLYLEQAGASQIPVVTVTYFDADSDPVAGGDQPCPNDVDVTKHGIIRNFLAVALPALCDISVVGSVTTDNGDGDFFVDTAETVDMQITVVNNCGIDVTNCSARLFTNDPKVDCILKSQIDLGDIETSAEVGVVLSADAFKWKLRNDVVRSDLDDSTFNAEFNVTIVCDEFDSVINPQSLAVALDLDINTGGQTGVAWTEGFEFGLGKFQTENLDVGIPGANNAEGLANGDGWRCQYSDPDWPNSASYGDDQGLHCYPGVNLAQANAVFWALDGSGLNLCDVGRAHTGLQSLHYGECLTAGNILTSPISTVESVRTTNPINLGVGTVTPQGLTLELKWWHQVSLVDGTFLNVPVLRAADAGVVQYKTLNAGGADTSVWTSLDVFQNSYDVQRYDFYFNCMFDPVDDGNNEDDFFEPTNPDRRDGPSSTCFPEVRWARLGDTDEPFNQDNIGNGTTSPGAAGEGSLGIGTWVESKVDLAPLKGRRIKVRYLASSIKADQETHEEYFGGMLGQWYDDGWWIDDVNVNNTLTSPATFAFDTRVIGHCSNNAAKGCVIGGTLPPACTSCVAGAPGCGDTCKAQNSSECIAVDNPFDCCTGNGTGTCNGGAGEVTVAVSTTPENGGGNFLEVLSAPGQPIEIDASVSTGTCVNGVLQYRFTKDGNADACASAGNPDPCCTGLDTGICTVVREWSEDSVILDAPLGGTNYGVQARCSSDPTAPANVCDSDFTTVVVDVNCPSSGTLGFGNPQMVMSATPPKASVSGSWGPWGFSVDVVVGKLYHPTIPAGTLLGDSVATGVYTNAVTACVEEDELTDSFSHASGALASGQVIFYLVRTQTGFCNVLNDGSFSYGGVGEVAGRNATIPNTAPGCDN